MLIILFEPVLSSSWIFFYNQWFWFFENLKAKQPTVPISSEVFRIKEPTFSFLKDPQKTTCYGEGY